MQGRKLVVKVEANIFYLFLLTLILHFPEGNPALWMTNTLDEERKFTDCRTIA